MLIEVWWNGSGRCRCCGRSRCHGRSGCRGRSRCSGGGSCSNKSRSSGMRSLSSQGTLSVDRSVSGRSFMGQLVAKFFDCKFVLLDHTVDAAGVVGTVAHVST